MPSPQSTSSVNGLFAPAFSIWPERVAVCPSEMEGMFRSSSAGAATDGPAVAVAVEP